MSAQYTDDKGEPSAKQGPEWAFMRWLKLRNPDGTKYLDRLRLVQTPWFGVYLHWLYGPDAGRDYHDHPWNFLSFVLRGWYEEWVSFDGGCRSITSHAISRRIRWINFKRATDTHRVASTARPPVITLVFVGRRQRKWGFVTPQGWVVAEDYFASGRGTVKL